MRPRDNRIAIVVVVVLSLGGGCRRSLAPDAGGNGQIGIDAGPDGATNVGGDGATLDVAPDAIADAAGDAAPFGCGKILCPADHVCVSANLCGGPLVCQDLPDGGGCPPGTTLNPSCPNGPGCVPLCMIPAPVCAPRPDACGSTLDCACAGSVCNGKGACLSASGRSVTCANS